MKVVPKAQYGRSLVAQPDNTRVAKSVIPERIEYKLKPGEFFFTDRRTGKKTLVKKKKEIVSADTRSTYQRQRDQKRAEQVRRQYEEDKKQEEGIKNLQGFLTFISPSTYIGPAFNSNGRSYTENVMSGKGIGNVVGNVAIDILTPFAIGGTKSIASKLLPKSITVYKGGTKPFTRDYTFFTTDPQYASQFGPVQKYKLRYRNPAYAKEPLIYDDMEGIHYYIDSERRLTGKPQSDVIIGHDKITDEVLSNGQKLQPSNGTEYVVWDPSQIKPKGYLKTKFKSELD